MMTSPSKSKSNTAYEESALPLATMNGLYFDASLISPMQEIWKLMPPVYALEIRASSV